ncbi:potassium/proton antiporter [Aquibacillus saliphilus]|uniref:potassium/proton antiporter n=1 Tax=Aquibacillus saliphilus TaxID=1909422 RepID=UPI001CF0D139|nr:potassium/proton antiporter [Aquibacillus saliphilus]
MEQELITSNQFIVLIALLLIVSVLVTKFSSRLGVPSLVLFIGVGMVVGSDGLNIIYFDNAKVAQMIGIFSLVVILFEGGLQTKWSTIRPVMAPAVSLATIGVLITAIIVAVFAKYIFGFTWLEAFLIGSIVGSTDAAAVFAVLKGKNINMKIEATLEAESGTNDPMAVFLTVSFIELLTLNHEANIWYLFGSFFWQMGVGALLGLIIGHVASKSINRINLESSGLYPLFALSFAFLAYSITSFASASGLLAVYITALVVGNLDLTYRQSILRFNEGFAWMVQILMFIILGLFVFPSSLFSFDILLKGLLLSIVLIFLARPVATFISLFKFPFNNKEKLFLSWAGLRGAVPIVLALFPLLAEVENSQVFFNAVFFVVITSTLIQGSTISLIARKFGLVGPKKTAPMHTLELNSAGKTNVEIIEYEVLENNKIVGEKLEELNFPKKALINAIIRKGDVITPHGQTIIDVGDILYIMVIKNKVNELEKMLQKNIDEPNTENDN